jgi:PQQ-dependent catabolism-associated CXXCW motif protein
MAIIGLLQVSPTLAGASPSEQPGAIPLSAIAAEPDGYRMDDYNAATPATIKGGTVLTTSELNALRSEGGAIPIDVLPQQSRPESLPATTLWIEKPHHSIPGSAWLPGVGRGALSPGVEAYFRDALARLTADDPNRRLVFYCHVQCWMSWNAAKRAIGYGYRHVYWYRDGIEGWTAAGLPTEVARPFAAASKATAE